MDLQGKFAIGVDYEGKVLADFVLRPRRIRDTIEAIEQMEKNTSNVRLEVVLMARCLSIPGIPQECINADFLLDMHDADHEVLLEAAKELTKKLKARNEPSAPSA